MEDRAIAGRMPQSLLTAKKIMTEPASSATSAARCAVRKEMFPKESSAM